jgi:transcriptional regulator with XRE-family HTH domain
MRADEVWEMRRSSRIARAAVAKKLGLSPQAIQRIEEGRKPMPADYPTRLRQSLRDIAAEQLARVVDRTSPS